MTLGCTVRERPAVGPSPIEALREFWAVGRRSRRFMGVFLAYLRNSL